jgi:hypothetical protein
MPKLVNPHEVHFMAVSTQVLQLASHAKHFKGVVSAKKPLGQTSEQEVVPNTKKWSTPPLF